MQRESARARYMHIAICVPGRSLYVFIERARALYAYTLCTCRLRPGTLCKYIYVYIERERHTDRQTDRQTDREIDKERQREKESERASRIER